MCHPSGLAAFSLLIGTIEAQQGDERGQVVLDTVMDLREEDLFLFEGILELRLILVEFLLPGGDRFVSENIFSDNVRPGTVIREYSPLISVSWRAG